MSSSPPSERGAGADATAEFPTVDDRRSSDPASAQDRELERADENSRSDARSSDGGADSASAPAGAGPPPGEVAGPVPAAAGRGSEEARPPVRRARRARLVLRRIDPWSVAKMTLVISLALLIVFLVAVGVLYLVLDVLGVFDTVNETVRDLTSSGEEDATGGLEIVFSAGRVLGASALLGGVYVLLATALATLGALLYNVCADLAGGIEVTLTEAG